MHVRDRIQELRRVPAAQLKTNPRNWRLHPVAQRARVQAILNEVGYADALLARELADGTLELIDGHLRADLDPLQHVPVLVLDVDAGEADKLLATFDPLAAQAEADAVRLHALLRSIDWHDPELSAFSDELLTAQETLSPAQPSSSVQPALAETFQLLVDCDGEPALQALFERLQGEGYRCRVLML